MLNREKRRFRFLSVPSIPLIVGKIFFICSLLKSRNKNGNRRKITKKKFLIDFLERSPAQKISLFHLLNCINLFIRALSC